MRYFKTTSPSSVVYTPSGLLRWESEDGDEGFYATESPGALKVLDKFLESRKPGNTPVGPPLQEITKEDYEAFLGKSKGRRFEREREHIRGVGVVPATVPRSQTVDAPAAEVSSVSAVVPTIRPGSQATASEAAQLDASIQPANLRRRNAK